MKYVIGLMLASLSIFTYAQRIPLACQDDRAAGLNWEQGRWNVRSFNSEKFILVRDSSRLTTDSVNKAFNLPEGDTNCEVKYDGNVLCYNSFGASLFFSPKSNKGGISLLYGATSENNARRDTVTVQAFTCTPF